MTVDVDRASLSEFLDLQREALIAKLHGLSEAQARLTPTVSALSLLSLIKHSAFWEWGWFQVIVAGRFPEEWPRLDSDDLDTFGLDDEDTIESVIACYRVHIAASQEILMTLDLDGPSAHLAEHTLRRVALHMIEETARHAGHADIIRETIDGMSR